MASIAHLSSEERVGIGVAVVAHVALAAALAWHATREAPPFAPAQRINVSLASDISLDSTAPDPSLDPAASMAPIVTDEPQVPEELETAPPVEPKPVPTATPRAAPTTRPTTRATASPTPTPTRRAEGNLESEFADLGRSDNRDGESGSPAASFGPAERAALSSAITRQLRGAWRGTAPTGVDAELLVSVVSWQLNRDGTVRGTPRCVDQRGITASNRPQAALHCERAIRAVRTAAPFNLPEQFYSHWDNLQWDFDRSL